MPFVNYILINLRKKKRQLNTQIINNVHLLSFKKKKPWREVVLIYSLKGMKFISWILCGSDKSDEWVVGCHWDKKAFRKRKNQKRERKGIIKQSELVHKSEIEKASYENTGQEEGEKPNRIDLCLGRVEKSKCCWSVVPHDKVVKESASLKWREMLITFLTWTLLLLRWLKNFYLLPTLVVPGRWSNTWKLHFP